MVTIKYFLCSLLRQIFLFEGKMGLETAIEVISTLTISTLRTNKVDLICFINCLNRSYREQNVCVNIKIYKCLVSN